MPLVTTPNCLFRLTTAIALSKIRQPRRASSPQHSPAKPLHTGEEEYISDYKLSTALFFCRLSSRRSAASHFAGGDCWSDQLSASRWGEEMYKRFTCVNRLVVTADSCENTGTNEPDRGRLRRSIPANVPRAGCRNI